MSEKPKNVWELYEIPGWTRAHRALEAAWKRAEKAKSASEAYKVMEAVMGKYRNWGASDSEPYAELEHRMRKHREALAKWGDS
jgi:hypothetical protein